MTDEIRREIKLGRLRSLAAGIDWLRSVSQTDERAVPTKLHSLDTVNQGELGAPAMMHAFFRHLIAQPWDTFFTAIAIECRHDVDWRSSVSCSKCHGAGFYEVERERYRYPYWRACHALDMKPAIRPGHPSPSQLIAGLVALQYDPDAAWRFMRLTDTVIAWEVYEALALMAIRDLSARYSVGPLPRRVAPSESQSIAEVATAS